MIASRSITGTVLSISLFALAACQTGSPLGGLTGDSSQDAEREQVEEFELLAFCPRTVQRQSTSLLNRYAGGSDGDSDSLIYRATIAETTRSCSYQGDTITMNIAAAGRVVPGPAASTGTITLPIRVMVRHGADTVYSQRHDLPVQISDTVGASQFIFTDNSVSMPMPEDRNVAVFIGFDE